VDKKISKNKKTTTRKTNCRVNDHVRDGRRIYIIIIIIITIIELYVRPTTHVAVACRSILNCTVVREVGQSRTGTLLFSSRGRKVLRGNWWVSVRRAGEKTDGRACTGPGDDGNILCAQLGSGMSEYNVQYHFWKGKKTFSRWPARYLFLCVVSPAHKRCIGHSNHVTQVKNLDSKTLPGRVLYGKYDLLPDIATDSATKRNLFISFRKNP